MSQRILVSREQRIQQWMDDAMCDAYDEQEQLSGFFTIIEDSIKAPCEARVAGTPVSVLGVDMTDTRILAICKRAHVRTKYRIDIRDVTIDPKTPVSECIDAYRRWSREDQTL